MQLFISVREEQYENKRRYRWSLTGYNDNLL